MTTLSYYDHSGDTTEKVIIDLAPDGTWTEVAREAAAPLTYTAHGYNRLSTSGNIHHGIALEGEPDAPATEAQRDTIARWRLVKGSCPAHQVDICVQEWGGTSLEDSMRRADVQGPIYRNR